MPFVYTGDRTALVQIQQKIETNRDPQNKPLYGWPVFAEAWVQIAPVRGQERDLQGVERSNAYFTMAGDFYDLDGVTSNMRVAYDEQGTFDDDTRTVYFDIEAVMRDFVSRNETILRVRQTVQPAAGL